MFRPSLKIIISIFFIFNILAVEVSKEVTVEKASRSGKELEQELKLKGLEEILLNQFGINGIDVAKFKGQVEKKNFSKENYLSFLDSFFNKAELIILSSNDNNQSNDVLSGVVNVDLDQNVLIKKATEIIEDLDLYKKNNFYFEFNLDLLGNTNWEDLGVNSELIFRDALEKSWRDLLVPIYSPHFSNVIFMQNNDKNIIEKFSDIIPMESVILKLNIKIRKTYEKAINSKQGYEVTGDYILIKARDRSSIMSYDFPIQKKELSTKNKKELSSNIASLVYNFLKFQTKKIEEKIVSKNQFSELKFKIIGQSNLSELTKVQSSLENYLAIIKGKVLIKKYGLTDGELAILDIPQDNLMIMLNKMGKIPLSDDKNEQKVLLFNPETKSFAITQKD